MLEWLQFVLSGCVDKISLDANSHLITTISIIVIKKTATALTTALIIPVYFHPFRYFHHI